MTIGSILYTLILYPIIQLKEEQFADIRNVIQNASDSKELAELRAKAKKLAWEHIGEAGKLTLDFMISKVE